MKYEVEWLLECILIRVKSPATYEHLRLNNILPLPCRDTLRKITSSLKSEFGFNDFSLECIRKHFANKPLAERYGSLMWDEMSIIQDIHFDKHSFKFKGFTYLNACEEERENENSALDEEWQEDNEEFSTEQQDPLEIPDLADHALVLIFRPYKSKWIQPIAVFA